MAVIRQENWQGQQRIDIQHLRAIESAVCNDFDVLAGLMMAGGAPAVVSGFVIDLTGAVGSTATSLVLKTADSLLIHYNASVTGSIFRVPSDRADEILTPVNTRVVGGFTPSVTNYVGIDLQRTADPDTVDTVEFYASGQEFPRVVPLARTLDYKIIISTTTFSTTPGIAPIAKVVLDAAGKVVSIEDCRWMLFGLASGGDSANTQNVYSWANGRTDTGFLGGGERSLGSLKSWCDAVMSRLFELGGGEHWYSQTADRNVLPVYVPPVFPTTGQNFYWSGVNLWWKGVGFIFDNSTGIINEVADQVANSAGLTNLADGECIYVDLDRANDRLRAGSPLVPQKVLLTSLGDGSVPGSRYVIAWRTGSEVYARSIPYALGALTGIIATTVAYGHVKLTSYPAAGSTYAAFVDMAGTGKAVAAGLTRTHTNSLFAAGDITIGGGASDHDVLIYTVGNTYKTSIRGQKTLAVNDLNYSALFVQNNVPASNAVWCAVFESNTHFAGGINTEGSWGLPRVYGTPVITSAMMGAINPTVTGGVGCKMYIRNSPSVDPATGKWKLQLCVLWPDQTEPAVIAESPLY